MKGSKEPNTRPSNLVEACWFAQLWGNRIWWGAADMLICRSDVDKKKVNRICSPSVVDDDSGAPSLPLISYYSCLNVST